jgi:hypothetical protein
VGLVEELQTEGYGYQRQGPGGGNGWSDFKGEARRSGGAAIDTHASTTDPEAKLARRRPGPRESVRQHSAYKLHRFGMREPAEDATIGY